MPESNIRITVLGSGTSVGVPTIGCHCDVCTSTDPRDNRLRPSILVTHEGRNILIDTTPDFRYQALRARIDRLDAIVFTHEHADHIMGLDDVRPFNFRQRATIPIFASPKTMEAVHRCFEYIFDGRQQVSSVPKLESIVVTGEPFDVFGLRFIPVPIDHGPARIFGYRFGRAAYLTDHSAIPEDSFHLLNELDVLFLDALRLRPHPTHSTLDLAVKNVERAKPRRAFFTHICHDLPHARTEEKLPPHIRLAYDGLELEVPAE
jgi:phosphoribosyl 1,2-cyclic phosphate phosphodiesterase